MGAVERQHEVAVVVDADRHQVEPGRRLQAEVPETCRAAGAGDRDARHRRPDDVASRVRDGHEPDAPRQLDERRLVGGQGRIRRRPRVEIDGSIDAGSDHGVGRQLHRGAGGDAKRHPTRSAEAGRGESGRRVVHRFTGRLRRQLERDRGRPAGGRRSVGHLEPAQVGDGDRVIVRPHDEEAGIFAAHAPC